MKYLWNAISNKDFENNIAIVEKDKSFTYLQINDYSTMISKILVNEGLFQGDLVVILLPKSIECIIFQLSIMKAGAYFVVVDTQSPNMRISSILELCNPKIVICSYVNYDLLDSQLMRLYSLNYISDFYIYHKNQSFKKLNEKVNRIVNEDSLAYTIFTSGSTGKPKGVQVSHGGICSYIRKISKLLKYDTSTKVLLLSSICFDASIHDIYTVFYCGGTLYIPESSTTINSVYNDLDKYSITDITVVSTTLKLISKNLNQKNFYKLRSLKSIVFCGESCPLYVLETIRGYLPNIQLIQGYGPTENSIGSIFNIITDFTPSPYGYLPLGKPLSDVETFLVRNNKIVSAGEVGELYVAGEQLMKGYYNDAEMTKSVLFNCDFLENKLVYKTGDYMMINEKDEYCFVGRKDDMVKINGNLVYTSEIEKCLLLMPGVTECCVTVFQDNHDTKKLALFVQSDKELNEHKIMLYLKFNLPQYMIPKKIIFVDFNNIDKTTTGKVDKKKLLDLIK